MRDVGAVQQRQQQQKSHRRGLTEDDMDQPSRPTIRPPPTQTKHKKKGKKNRKNVKTDSSLKKDENLKRSADLVLAPATQPGAVHMNQDYPTTKSEQRRLRQQQQQQQDQQYRPPHRQGSDKSSLSRLSMAPEPVTDDSVTTNTVTVSTRPSLGQQPQQRSTGRSTRSTLSGSSRSMRSNFTGSLQGGSTRSGFTVNTMGTASNASKPGAHAVFNSNAIPEDASVTHSLSTHSNNNNSTDPPLHDLESSSDPVASVIDPNDLEAEIEERVNREAASRVQSMIQTAQVTLVQSMEQPSTPHPAVGFGVPEEEEQEEKEGRSFMERMLLPLICCVMIVLGASVGTVLVVILTRNSGSGGGDSTNSNNTGGGVVNNTNTPGPQAPPPVGAPSAVTVGGEDIIPTFSPTTNAWSDVESVVVNVTSLARLRDPTSPQYAAMQWILQEDTLFPTLPLAEQQERFVLVTLFFATMGPVTWTRQARFLSPSVHVCDWNDVFQQVVYGLGCENPLEGTRVTRVDLRKCLCVCASCPLFVLLLVLTKTCPSFFAFYGFHDDSYR